MKMNRSSLIGLFVPVIAALAGVFLLAAARPDMGDVKRGEYLVKGGGCTDCHTPLKMGPAGPAPDDSRFLSGHPAAMVMPPAPALPEGPWLYTAAATMTAWAGPWGVSFTANLTPDRDTGLGTWTAQTFVDTIRSGRVMGRGRLLLPPMPYQAMQYLTDADLRAIFAYLQSLPRMVNKVPDPIPPAPVTR
jgi:mono/diheme cytochrome c family protein